MELFIAVGLLLIAVVSGLLTWRRRRMASSRSLASPSVRVQRRHDLVQPVPFSRSKDDGAHIAPSITITADNSVENLEIRGPENQKQIRRDGGEWIDWPENK